MSVGPVVRVAAAILLLLAGTTFAYFAVWVAWTEIVPQIRQSGLSLTGSNLILNRNWRGNQLYLLVGLYALAGCGLVAGGLALWRRRRRDDGIDG